MEPRYLGAFSAWGCPRDDKGNITADKYIITLELAIKQNTPGVLQGTICGSGMSNDINDRFTYWMLGSFPKDKNPQLITFKFKTGDRDNGSATVHELPLGVITDTNLHRITIQLNIGNGQCAAWLDGTQTAELALGAVVNDDGTLNANKELWRYEQGAFQLGALADGALGDVTPAGLNPAQQQVDWTYGGLALVCGQRYSWDKQQKRLDGQVISDAGRFFPPASGQVAALLPLTEHPDMKANAGDGQLVMVSQGQNIGNACGLWLPERLPVKDKDGLFGLRNIRVAGLTPYGPLTVGEVRDLSLDNIMPHGYNIFTFRNMI